MAEQNGNGAEWDQVSIRMQPGYHRRLRIVAARLDLKLGACVEHLIEQAENQLAAQDEAERLCKEGESAEAS